MTKTLKTAHLVGLTLFLGSIPAHIVLGRLAMAHADVAAAVALLEAKHAATLVLTLPGLALSVATGLALLLANRGLLRTAWLRAKLVLVALVALNGALVLTPVGAAMAERASHAGSMDELRAALAPLAARESAFGAANLAMALAAVALAVARPRLRRRRAATGETQTAQP
jgi:hypothetical protein